MSLNVPHRSLYGSEQEVIYQVRTVIHRTQQRSPANAKCGYLRSCLINPTFLFFSHLVHLEALHRWISDERCEPLYNIMYINLRSVKNTQQNLSFFFYIRDRKFQITALVLTKCKARVYCILKTLLPSWQKNSGKIFLL